MSATNVFENGLLDLIFSNANYANVGDATGLRGSSTAGVFYLSLHTADPGEGGSQNTTEAGYTSYARKSVARASSEWTAASGVCDNDNVQAFVAASGGSATVTHVGIGSDTSGAGNLFMTGTASLSVSTGITPQFAAGALDITMD